nr:hypothetical protein [Cytophagales bacterium]
MKFLFDQNISHKILKVIPKHFSTSSTIKKERLLNATDREIWYFAKNNGFIIVTQDSDFNDLNLLYGFPPKIIWIRTGNLKTQDLADILTEHTTEIQKFIENESFGCFEIFRMKKQ